jgi:hypothetical protein
MHVILSTQSRYGNRKGIALVEVIVGTSIIVTSILVMVMTFGNLVHIDNSLNRKVQASLLVEEGFEVVKLLRDEGWDQNIQTLQPSAEHFIYFDSGSWHITPSSTDPIDNKFTRVILFEDVFRDSYHDIAPSGNLDPDTKLVTVTVSYFTSRGIASTSAQTYITNLFDN